MKKLPLASFAASFAVIGATMFAGMFVGVQPAQAAKDPLEITQVSMSPVAGKPDFRSLKVRLVSTPRCVMGDFEAIVYDRIGSPDSGIVFSVEPVLEDDKSFAGSTQVVTDPARILSGAEIGMLEVPYSDTPKIYGIYICKKSAPEETCRSKPVMPINDILKEHSTDNKPPKRFFRDRTYFFAFVLTAGEQAFVSKAEFNPEMKDLIYSFLRTRVLDEPRFEEIFQTIWKRIKVLGPYPLGATPDSVTVSIPRYDRDKCANFKKRM